jgi:hypothetical protein
VVSLLLFCALGVGAILLTSKSAAQDKAGADERGETSVVAVEAPIAVVAGRDANPLGNINDKSRAANKGSEADIRGLADEIFTRYQFNEAPAAMSEPIKERLVRAEISYRNGKGQEGISDASIVRAINYLAYKTGAPAYAQTNVFELRRMKAAVRPYTAELQSRSRATNGVLLSDGKSIANDAQRPTMSPLEATFFAMLLVQQKQFNPEYQLTNQEFVVLHGGKRQATSGKLFQGEMLSRRSDATRTNQLEQAVEKGFASMKLPAVLDLPGELMFVLGIQK